MTNITWEFDSAEKDAVLEVVEDHRSRPFVRRRIKRNVESSAPTINRSYLWAAHLMAQLTSVQRSGPEAPVARFLRGEQAKQLTLQRCQDAERIEPHVAGVLKEFGGIRFHNNIGEACAMNFHPLEAGGWEELEKAVASLQELRGRDPGWKDWVQERKICKFLYGGIQGEGLHRIGPKQSRNFLQALGLTRFETPLDSRISKWINENLDFPYRLTGSGLSEPAFYDFHMDLVRGICESVDILPCVFDAAVFASYDEAWPEYAVANTSGIDNIAAEA